MMRSLGFICLCNLLLISIGAAACQYETVEGKFRRFFFIPRQVKAHHFFDDNTVAYFYSYLPVFKGEYLCSFLKKIKRKKEECWISRCEKVNEMIERKSRELYCFAVTMDLESFKPLFFRELEMMKKEFLTYWDIIKQKPKKDDKLFLHYFEDPSTSANSFFSGELIGRYKHEFTRKNYLSLLLEDIKDVYAYSWKAQDQYLLKKARFVYGTLKFSAEKSSDGSFNEIFCCQVDSLKEALCAKIKADEKNEKFLIPMENYGCFKTVRGE